MNETTQTTAAAGETLLDQLVEKRLLELEGNSDRARLAAGISQVLSSGTDVRQRASALAQWLLGQESVAELYATDDELAAILEQW